MSVIESVTQAQRTAAFAVPAAPASVGLARAEAIDVFRVWGVPVDADIATLLLSEVVTNAVQYGFGSCPAPGEQIEIDMRLVPGSLRIAVHDSDRGDSGGVSVRHPDMNSENGRGLELVEVLSTSWGCERTARGKCVYFELEAASPEPDTSCHTHIPRSESYVDGGPTGGEWAAHDRTSPADMHASGSCDAIRELRP